MARAGAADGRVDVPGGRGDRAVRRHRIGSRPSHAHEDPSAEGVIPHAPSSDWPPTTQAAIDGGRAKLGLGGRPNVVSLGTREPRKNHHRLVAALEIMRETEPDLALVLIGGDGSGRRGGWERRSGLSADDSVIVTGYLESWDVVAVAAGAQAFAYVSLYEGFGLPVVEAWASAYRS